MALKSFQTTVALGKLYKINKKGAPNGAGEQISPNLFVNSGSVDVYVYNGATEPAALANMVLDTSGISACEPFDVLPTYISFVQNTGTTTELVISGVEVELIGDIA